MCRATHTTRDALDHATRARRVTDRIILLKIVTHLSQNCTHSRSPAAAARHTHTSHARSRERDANALLEARVLVDRLLVDLLGLAREPRGEGARAHAVAEGERAEVARLHARRLAKGGRVRDCEGRDE